MKYLLLIEDGTAYSITDPDNWIEEMKNTALEHNRSFIKDFSEFYTMHFIQLRRLRALHHLNKDNKKLKNSVESSEYMQKKMKKYLPDDIIEECEKIGLETLREIWLSKIRENIDQEE